MTGRRGALPLGPLAIGGALLVAVGVAAWQLQLQQLDRRAQQKRAALKKLVLTGGIPPNQEVMNYLTARHTSLERRYAHWLDAVAAPPMAEEAQADPQLYFQQQVHEVQRTIERLATGRGVPVPEQLGLPKDLPPPDAVPRLLAQLALMQEATQLLYEQGVEKIASVKIEDPTAMAEREEAGAFLFQLPVRVRFTANLADLMKALGATERVRPLIDVLSLRVGTGTAAGAALEVDALFARYLVSGASEPGAEKPEPTRPRPPTGRKRETGKPAAPSTAPRSGSRRIRAR